MFKYNSKCDTTETALPMCAIYRSYKEFCFINYQNRLEKKVKLIVCRH